MRPGRRTPFVGVSDGRDLFAVTTTGECWSVRAPARIAAIDWSSDDGFRVAYVAGDELRIVAGDGTPAGAPTVAEEVASRAIAWRPSSCWRPSTS